MKAKYLIILSLILALTLLLAACSSDAEPASSTNAPAATVDEPAADAKPEAPAAAPNWITATDISAMPDTTIRFWFYETPERQGLGKELVAEFEALHPNIKIEVSTAPQYVEGETLFAYIKAKKNSAIQYSVNIEDGPYIENNLAYPLNNFPDFDEVAGRLQPALQTKWTDGNTYSLPAFYDPIIMFYNKQMVVDAGLDPTNPPKTYSEFMAWGEALTQKDATSNVTQAFVCPWVGEDWWMYGFMQFPYYVAATGTNALLTEDGTKAVFNTPEGLASFKLIEDLKSNGYLIDGNIGDEPFYKETCAAMLFQTVVFQQMLSKGLDFELIAGPVPVPDGTPAGGYTSYAFTRSYTLIDEISLAEGPERDAYRRAAWEWMKFLLEEENMARDFAVSGEVPTAVDVYTNPIYQDTFDKLGFAIATPYLDNQTNAQMASLKVIDVYAEMQKAFASVMSGRSTAVDALNLAETNVNALLAK